MKSIDAIYGNYAKIADTELNSREVYSSVNKAYLCDLALLIIIHPWFI